MTKQSQNFVNALSIYTNINSNELLTDLSVSTQMSLENQTQELLLKAKETYDAGKVIKDDLGFDLTLEQVETAIKSRFGRYQKWDITGIKTFNERLIQDICKDLRLEFKTTNNELVKLLKEQPNGVLVYKDGSTFNFMLVKEGKVDKPMELYSAPKMMANGKFHRFSKEVIGIIA